MCLSVEKIEHRVSQNELLIKIPSVEFEDIIVRVEMENEIVTTLTGIDVSSDAQEIAIDGYSFWGLGEI